MLTSRYFLVDQITQQQYQPQQQHRNSISARSRRISIISMSGETGFDDIINKVNNTYDMVKITPPSINLLAALPTPPSGSRSTSGMYIQEEDEEEYEDEGGGGSELRGRRSVGPDGRPGSEHSEGDAGGDTIKGSNFFRRMSLELLKAVGTSLGSRSGDGSGGGLSGFMTASGRLLPGLGVGLGGTSGSGLPGISKKSLVESIAEDPEESEADENSKSSVIGGDDYAIKEEEEEEYDDDEYKEFGGIDREERRSSEDEENYHIANGLPGINLPEIMLQENYDPFAAPPDINISAFPEDDPLFQSRQISQISMTDEQAEQANNYENGNASQRPSLSNSFLAYEDRKTSIPHIGQEASQQQQPHHQQPQTSSATQPPALSYVYTAPKRMSLTADDARKIYQIYNNPSVPSPPTILETIPSQSQIVPTIQTASQDNLLANSANTTDTSSNSKKQKTISALYIGGYTAIPAPSTRQLRMQIYQSAMMSPSSPYYNPNHSMQQGVHISPTHSRRPSLVSNNGGLTTHFAIPRAPSARSIAEITTAAQQVQHARRSSVASNNSEDGYTAMEGGGRRKSSKSRRASIGTLGGMSVKSGVAVAGVHQIAAVGGGGGGGASGPSNFGLGKATPSNGGSHSRRESGPLIALEASPPVDGGGGGLKIVTNTNINKQAPSNRGSFSNAAGGGGFGPGLMIPANIFAHSRKNSEDSTFGILSPRGGVPSGGGGGGAGGGNKMEIQIPKTPTTATEETQATRYIRALSILRSPANGTAASSVNNLKVDSHASAAGGALKIDSFLKTVKIANDLRSVGEDASLAKELGKFHGTL
jgi:hypothetical protein